MAGTVGDLAALEADLPAELPAPVAPARGETPTEFSAVLGTTKQSGETGRKGARIGRTFTVKVTTRDGESATKRPKLTRERRGDDHGKRLGC